VIEVLFFARIREQLGIGSLQLAWDGSIDTVESLVQSLVADRGPKWGDTLQADNVVVAVNQQVCDKHKNLVDGDEIAFFPPVTGG